MLRNMECICSLCTLSCKTFSRMAPQLTEFEKGRMIGLLEAGLSVRNVARRVGRCVSVVQRWWSRWKTNGSCHRQVGSGRPRLSSRRDDQYLRLVIRRYPFLNGSALRQRWRNATGTLASVYTVTRRARDMHLRSYRPLIQIPLSRAHREARRQWCQERIRWGRDQWRRIVFSDESRFCMDFNDGRLRVRRLPSERYSEPFIVPHDRYGGRSIIVWGAISVTGKTELVTLRGNITAQRYVDDIVRPHIVPFMRDHEQRVLFQQDNARPHTAAVTMRCFDEENVDLLPWPARSPDLNIIEHVWDMLGRRLSAEETPPESLDELQQHLERYWADITDAQIRTLYDSVQRRFNACQAARGGHTRY